LLQRPPRDCRRCIGNGAKNLAAMAERNIEILEILLGQFTEHRRIDRVGDEAFGIFRQPEAREPVCNGSHRPRLRCFRVIIAGLSHALMGLGPVHPEKRLKPAYQIATKQFSAPTPTPFFRKRGKTICTANRFGRASLFCPHQCDPRHLRDSGRVLPPTSTQPMTGAVANRREKIMLAPRETQELKARHESNADGIVAGVWLALYALAILSAIGSPILIAAAAQVW